MNLRARLSERVHIEDIREVLHFIQDDKRLREEVYQLIFDEDPAIWLFASCTYDVVPKSDFCITRGRLIPPSFHGRDCGN